MSAHIADLASWVSLAAEEGASLEMRLGDPSLEDVSIEFFAVAECY
jgi:hypothetical protein